jgi:hypothetical protein
MLQKHKDYLRAQEGRNNERVWIELERPPLQLPEDEQDRIANERAAKCSKMIERLCGAKDYCFWLTKQRRYAFGGQMGFYEATDDGHWFNLDVFAGTEAN